ncbi:hypothetical protein LTR99_003209 [Exophiala xenobiotica]|uniref:Acyltransferase 3 domain-containing protein n=1 Tax=Vermiconidia calcicola TaxID=1690605 RepID=A0AAV9QDH8_9PEZI|nr:hypothetical protein LTR96_006822 [Exophiala xenobiotica]KAK5305665.1 hypothetical protein LTR99_003209 [Exophiala xenobiotica]KAK5538875.1 hypothetical protein LTR25_004419 [Vermiconidia calcicola]KAK5557626.1 hypothetical protein LTR46_004654 [Exophiala xenobiotica]
MANMEEYRPLAHHDDQHPEVEDEDIDLSYVDLEKMPEEERPRWYQVPMRRLSSEWTTPSKWESADIKAVLFLVLGYILTVLPRFVQPGGMRHKSELHPTAYLDAMRGWAAISVARYHTFANKTSFLEYPVIRMILNGRAMVDIFFIISGYVLSYRLLKMIRNQQTGLLKALASSTFRRWWRLYISTGVASLVTAVMTYWGWCHPAPQQSSFLLQMWDWLWDFGASSNPFGDIKGFWYGEVFRTHYLDQMWTIPVEFRGSMAVFWFVAAACYMATLGRRMFACVVIVLCYWWGIIYAALFLYGMLIADFQFDRHPERLQKIRLPQQESDSEESEKPKTKKYAVLNIVGCVFLVIVGMFLMGQPPPFDGHYNMQHWPWQYMESVIPHWYVVELGEHFWLGIGAAIFVFAVDNCRPLQIPFEWGFSQYLGDISFGVYAMHNTINWVLYIPIVQPWCLQHFGDGYWSGAPGELFTSLVIIWAADYFTRIDEWVVWTGKWLESKTFIKWDE